MNSKLRFPSLELKQRHYDIREAVHPKAVWNGSVSHLKYIYRSSRFKSKCYLLLYLDSHCQKCNSVMNKLKVDLVVDSFLFIRKDTYFRHWRFCTMIVGWFFGLYGLTRLFLFKALIYIRVPHSSTTQTGIKWVEVYLFYSLSLKVFRWYGIEKELFLHFRTELIISNFKYFALYTERLNLV
jgi:hypothetical protein